MSKMDFLKEHKFIGILRRVNPTYVMQVVKAMFDGGVRIFEVTFDPCNKDTCAITGSIISQIKNSYGDEVMVGAGTVLYMDYAKSAYNAGAEFVVSPCTDKKIINYARKKGMLSMPGAYTPNEILSAYNIGADIVKIFPVAPDEAGYIKNVMAPLSHIPFMPTGGINSDTVKEFLETGAVAVGAGASIVTAELVENQDFEKITENAMLHIKKIQEYKERI